MSPIPGIHDALMHDLQVARIELDEVWAYVGKKQRRTAGEADKGDQYTFTALDATSCKIARNNDPLRGGFRVQS